MSAWRNHFTESATSQPSLDPLRHHPLNWLAAQLSLSPADILCLLARSSSKRTSWSSNGSWRSSPLYCSHQSFHHIVLVKALFWLCPPHPPTAVTSSLVTGTISQQHSNPSHYFQTSTTPPSRGALRPMCGGVLCPPVHSRVGEALRRRLQWALVTCRRAVYLSTLPPTPSPLHGCHLADHEGPHRA